MAETKTDFFNSFFSVNNFLLGIFSIKQLTKNSVLSLTALIILALLMVLIPLPAFLLDFFMMVNFVIALVIIITVVGSKKALDFSTFPIALLFATAFRLAVNVSSTRLILSKGTSFDGQVVRAFSDFVTGGNFLIGIVIFIIILTVQFFVITRGASRASEVSARFKLDALPGKQMAIDADLNAGLIDEKTALKRREAIQKEADFFGSMDGAGKFVSGEVIASFIIIFVNVIGGIIIGTAMRGEGFAVAADSYVRFAVGDGLVASIPSLLTAISSGIIVTRNVTEKNLAEDLVQEFFTSAVTYYVVGGFMFIVALIPGFPKMVLIPFSMVIIFFGYQIDRMKEDEIIETKEKDAQKKGDLKKEELSPEKIIEGIQIDPLEIEFGYELISLADPQRGGDLLERIKKCRRQLALELGLVIPRVRIADNMQLKGNEYQIKMNGALLSGSSLQVKKYMAIDSSGDSKINGRKPFKEPVFGLNAYWIEDEEKVEMEKRGFTVVDCSTVIATHFSELMKRNAAEMLGRKETQSMLDVVKKNNTALIGELKALNIKVSDVQQVFRALLAEQVSIRNVQTILETLCDAKGNEGLNIEQCVERVRLALRRQISAQYRDDANNINVIVFDPVLENEILSNCKEVGGVKFINMDPDAIKKLLERVSVAKQSAEEKGYKCPILCDGMIRKSVHRLIAHTFPSIPVLATDEIADGYYINYVEKI